MSYHVSEQFFKQCYLMFIYRSREVISRTSTLPESSFGEPVMDCGLLSGRQGMLTIKNDHD